MGRKARSLYVVLVALAVFSGTPWTFQTSKLRASRATTLILMTIPDVSGLVAAGEIPPLTGKIDLDYDRFETDRLRSKTMLTWLVSHPYATRLSCIFARIRCTYVNLSTIAAILKPTKTVPRMVINQARWTKLPRARYFNLPKNIIY